MAGHGLRRSPLALALASLALLAALLWLLMGRGPAVHYLPHYLPCPEIFGRDLQYPPWEQPAGHSPEVRYPQPYALEQTRPDVLTVTPWLAPIVWEGTFSPEVLDGIYKPLNLTIGMTVFAVGKYMQFVGPFLASAERFFMRGFRVHYYLFTDAPEALPKVHLPPGRTLSVLPVRRSPSPWEEISLRRMEAIHGLIGARAHREVDFLFCLDVDMAFHGPWGPESLGESVAALHPGYFQASRAAFPYERRRASSAFVAPGEGDFYYAGALFGGRVSAVRELTGACHAALLADKANGVMAAWQEESHLNRHFLDRRPTKLLSPEYVWDETKTRPPQLRLVRFSAPKKNHRALRGT